MSKIVLKTAVISFILMAGFLIATCSPYFLEYDNPVDPKAESYNGYNTVASAAEVIADWPEEDAEATWCVFRSSVVIDGGSDRYALQIASSIDGFETPLYEVVDSAGNVFNVSAANLSEGALFYRVKARTSDGEWAKDWSDVVGFTAVSGVNPDSLSPASGEGTIDTSPILGWNDVAGAASYEVEFSTSEASLDGSGAIPVDSSEYEIPDTDIFFGGGTCYWRVRGVSEEGIAGVWSRVFTVVIWDPEIGDNFEGGIVFYLDGSGGGLVCAESDQSTYIGWRVSTMLFVGGTSTAVGTGQANTTAIVEKQGSGWLSGDYAAKLCYKLELNDYTDWFLPSKEELKLMYENLYLQGLGNFKANTIYWSSSEISFDSVWGQGFGGYDDDGTRYLDKYSNISYHYVRAIRAFSY